MKISIIPLTALIRIEALHLNICPPQLLINFLG